MLRRKQTSSSSGGVRVAATEPRHSAFAVGLILAICIGSSDADSRVSADDPQFNDAGNGTNWPGYGRTYDESHFSPLDQINVGNVDRLGLKWSFDVTEPGGTVGAPLAVDGILYFPVGHSIIHAMSAETGRLLWTYDPKVGEVAGPKLRLGWGSRGIAYWNGKIFTGTQDGRVIAIDARTGKEIWTAHTLKPGDGLAITGAPRVFVGKVIIGNGGADYSAVRGYVTAYDTETGKQLWRFYTVPGDPAKGFENKAMEMAAKTWTGELWKHGGGGTAWNASTYDPEFDRIYIGTGNGSPWNAKIRSPSGGDNLFLCSIVALDAKTGKYVWHYQVNPAESWDWNAAMDIALATLEIAGKPRKVLMQAPKNGFFYVIDRETGNLISAEPFAEQNWAKRIDLQTGRPVENPEIRMFDGKHPMWPSGAAGAHSWEPMAYSPKTKLVYIPTTELSETMNDLEINLKTWKRGEGLNLDKSFQPLEFGPVPKMANNFGHLQAFDPVKQRRVWSVPLGAPLNGGVAATGGNLVFQGNMKGRFVAYAADTGKVLWDYDAQTGIIGQPITYLVKGKQYVTVLSGVSATPGMMAGLGGVPIWDYRTQKRRVLAFVLDGKASLPPVQKPTAASQLKVLGFPVEGTLALQGAGVYQEKCMMCHGISLRAGGSAPDLRQSPAAADEAVFSKIVRGGILKDSGMPQFDLSDAQLKALRNYIGKEAQ
jgi:quinohemoprotein ethanol dehydrogenase